MEKSEIFEDFMDYISIQSWTESHIEAIKELTEIKSNAAFYSLIMSLIHMHHCEDDDNKIVEGVTDLFINTIKIHGGKI